MEIKKLISVFERLLPIYKDAYKSGFDWFRLEDIGISYGLCFAALRNLKTEDLYEVFSKCGYYEELIPSTYLFPYPKSYRGLKSRIDFMESEIKDLKRLIKKGYTHV